MIGIKLDGMWYDRRQVMRIAIRISKKNYTTINHMILYLSQQLKWMLPTKCIMEVHTVVWQLLNDIRAAVPSVSGVQGVGHEYY